LTTREFFESFWERNNENDWFYIQRLGKSLVMKLKRKFGDWKENLERKLFQALF